MRRIMSFALTGILVFLTLTGCSMTDSTNSLNESNELDTKDSKKSIVERNTEFAFDIFKKLNEEDEGKNIFISPLSISTALSMTYQGSKDTTKEAMAKALRYEGIDIKNINGGYKDLFKSLDNTPESVNLDINNSIWIRSGEEINKDFINSNKDVFNAYVTDLDFSKTDAADKINSWINNSTKGKIQKMINPPINNDIIMYLINAIYFKGNWENSFDTKLTQRTEFYNEKDSYSTVNMMSKKGEFEYGEGKDYKALRLPYKGDNISMYFLLPNEDISIYKFIEALDTNKWEDIKDGLSKTQDLLVKIPRFKIDYGIKDLSESLSKLGMAEAFSDSADFSGIRDDITISKVFHKAIIEVNEEGSEAAATTVVKVKFTSAIVDPLTFIGDRPFIFVIADDTTESILFMGKLREVK